MDINEPPPPRPVRSRQRCSACRCLAIFFGLLGVAVVLFFFGMLGYGFYNMAKAVRDPHRSHVHADDRAGAGKAKLSPSSGSSGSSGVGPLFGPLETFDVVLSIWARIPNSQDTRPFDEDNLSPPSIGEAENTGVVRSGHGISALTGVPAREIMLDPIEENIFSQVVFTDFTLGTKDVETTVQFELPVDRFYDLRLYKTDVRVALSFLPRAEALSGLRNMSDWRPAVAGPMPRIPEGFTFPPGRADYSDPLHRDALERIAVSYGLISFHDIPSQCPSNLTTSASATASVSSSAASATSEAKEESEDEDGLEDDDEGEGVAEEAKSNSGSRFDPPAPPRRHPHIDTRTHFFVINETRRFDRKAFDKNHRQLSKDSCGQLMGPAMVARQMCGRTYTANGQWETRFVLSASSSSSASSNNDDHSGTDAAVRSGSATGTASEKTKIAYGPYLGWLKSSAGPKHLLRLPVDRENCTDPLNRTSPTSITVNYTLRLSSMTPGRLHLLDNFITPTGLSVNVTDKQMIDAHDSWEMMSGLLGSHTKGKRPFTRVLMSLIAGGLGFIEGTLNILYWYTRTTTSGLSLSALYLRIVALILDTVGFVEFTFRNEEEGGWPFKIFMLLLWSAWAVAPLVAMMRLAAGVEVEWGKGEGWGAWWPRGIGRRGWTHRERATRRAEAKIRAGVVVALILSSWATLYLISKTSLHLFSPSHTHRDPRAQTFLDIPLFHSFIASLRLTALGLQLYLNVRAPSPPGSGGNSSGSTGRFAGSYALAAYVQLGSRLLQWTWYLPVVVGKMDTNLGIGLEEVIWAGMEGWQAWQAATLPRVEQNEEGEEEE